MFRPVFIVAFAGHRKLPEPDAVRKAVRAQLVRLRERAEAVGGTLEYYASIAYGADAMAAEECRDLEIPVHLILPKPVVFKKDDSGEINRKRGFAADFWDGDPHSGGSFREADWNRSLEQIEDAQNGVGGGSLRISSGSQTDPECYYESGLRMLETCDVLLAVWDGEEAHGLGGTGDMVEYARHHDLPIVMVPPDGDSAGIRDERLVSFAREDDAGLAMMHEVEAFCCAAEETAPADEGAPDEGGDLFHRLDQYSKSEAAAFRNSLIKIIFAHGTATLVAAAAAILPQTLLAWKYVLAGLAMFEFMLIFWALQRTRKLHHRLTHERWMRTRFATEIMRGLQGSVGLLDPMHPLIARHLPEWRRFAITAGLQVSRGSGAPLDWLKARDQYVAERLRSPDWRKGQIAYFNEMQPKAKFWFKLTSKFGSVLGWLALGFVFCAFVFKCVLIGMKTMEYPYPKALANTDGASLWPWLVDFAIKFLPIALPLAAGVFIALRTALDSGRRTYRYEELDERLEAAATTLSALKTETAVRRTVAATEEILLDEVIEWLLAEQQNGAH